MGDDDDFLIVHHLGADGVVPVWQNAVNCDLQRLGGWQAVDGQLAVSLVEAGMSFVF